MAKGLVKAESSKQVTMTTKEVAQALGVGVSSVKRAVEKLSSVLGGVSKNTQGGYLFNEKQVTAIKQEVARHHNLASRQIDTAATDLEMYQNVQKCMEWLSMKNLELQQKAEALRIELDQSKEWASVKRMQALNDCAFDWRALRDYSKKHRYEIKKVFDQNYGEVNAYHKDVWEAVYGEQIEVWED